MSVEDKLKNLRKSMKETSLKDVEADKENTKQYVMNHKKKRFSTNGPKRLGQIGASLVALAALMLFVVIAGSGGLSLTQGDEPGVVQNESTKDLRYEMVVIHDGEELGDQEWKHIYNKQPMENYMKETQVLSDQTMEARRILASTPKPEGMYFPIAYVYDTEGNELVYRTDRKEDLKDFLSRLYQSPESDEATGEYELIGISIGDSFNKVLEVMGEPDYYSPGSDYASPYAGYEENGTLVVGVSINEQSNVDGIDIEVVKMEGTDLPKTRENIEEQYGQSTESKNVVCSEQETCLVQQYGQMIVKYMPDGTTVDSIEYYTSEQADEILEVFKPIEEGTVSAIHVKEKGESREMSEVLSEHKGLALSNSIAITEKYYSEIPSHYNMYLQALLTYDLNKHGEVVFLNGDGEILFRTKDAAKADHYLGNWEVKK